MNRTCPTCKHNAKSVEEDPCWACEDLRSGGKSQWEALPTIVIKNGFNSRTKDKTDARKSRKQ